MKFITIGDIHIKPYIIEEAEKHINSCDKMIFLGDYLDDFNYTNTEMYHSFKSIIDFKKKYKDKVVLLLGNHDLQYWYHGTKYQSYVYCSGFRKSMGWKIKNMILTPEVMSLFQPVYMYNYYLWSHAGITENFYDKYLSPKFKKELTFEENIIRLFNRTDTDLFNCSIARFGSKNEYEGGFFWTDKYELRQRGLSFIHQIVGHSRVDDIVTVTNINNPGGYTTGSKTITFCDCLDKVTKFYELEI